MSGRLPREVLSPEVREQIVQGFLIEGRSINSLCEEFDVSRSVVKTSVHRYRKSLSIFDNQISFPVMSTKKKKSLAALELENEELKRQLRIALLRIEGYEVMGNILKEEYGVDLLKKSAVKRSVALKKDTQK